MQPLCSQSGYQQIAHATYVGSMCTIWVPTNCPCKPCRPYVHNVSTNELPMQPMQALCAQCEYQQISHATYVGPMCTMWVPTNCPCSLCRLYVHNVSTNKLPMQPMQALCAQCGYQQIAQTNYVGPMFTMWVPTNCPCNLCRPYVHNVSTNKLPMQPMQPLCAQCEYQQIGHATYVAPMFVMWVPTNCPCNLCRLYVHYIGCMGNLLVPTLCTQGLHRLHGKFVGTHIVHIEPTQVAWAICWYPHHEHRGYIGCMANLLVLTLCTQGLHRLHGQFVGTHIVHIGPTQVAWAICWYPHCEHRAYIVCLGNLLVPTLCTQGLHRLHGQFVGTHIVHIEPTQVVWAICWYPHCAHRAYICCMGNLLVLTLCTQSLHRLHGQFVGTHIVHIGPTQVAWAICWYPHCAHRAYIGCMDNLLVLTLCTQRLHRLHGQFVGTHVVHIEPTQVAWAICWYSHCAHRAYIDCMGDLLVPTL